MDYSEQDIDDTNVDLVQSETVQDIDYASEAEDGEEQPEHEVQEEEVLNQEEGDSHQSASDDDDEFPGDHENSNQAEVEDAAGGDSDPNASGDDEEFPGNDEHSNQEEVETTALDDSHPSGDEEFVENEEQSNQEEEEDVAEGGTESEIIDETEIQDEMAGGVSETVIDEEVVEDAYENQEEESFADEQPQEFEEGAYATQEDVTEEVEVPIQEEYVTEEQEIDGGQESPGEQDAADEDSTALEQNQEDVEEKVGSPPTEVGDDNEKKDESEEEDFDNVVEIEQKAESDVEDENIAQHVSDSEDEDGKTDDVKLGDVSDDDLRGATSGSENEASDVEDTNISPVKKRTAIVSSDDEDDDAEKEKRTREKHEAAMKMFDSDSEDNQKEGVGELIADIFGESDDEGEEFTGFGAEEVGKQKPEKTKAPAISDSDEDEEYAARDSDTAPKPAKKSKPAEDSDSDEGVKEGSTQGMSDFDIMLAQKKEENRKHRKRRDNSTFISDADDIINAMLTKMKEAAEADREANQMRKPALKKLKMLPTVVAHLKKQNLKELFVDNGVIAAIADWISLLPDRSLPHITIRTELLKVLHDMPSVGPDTLKHSGIGKAVMILFKHPKEARPNRDSAGRLINKWSRPIFGLNENFKSMSREEREQRDLEQMPQAKRRKLTGGVHGNQSDEARPENELGHLRPGEVGFVMRARVPMPSTKDYVVRPKWNVETEGRDDEDSDTPARVIKRRRSAGAPRSSKKDERLEKHMRNFAEVKKSSKMQRAVKISIEGNKMSIL